MSHPRPIKILRFQGTQYHMINFCCRYLEGYKLTSLARREILNEKSFLSQQHKISLAHHHISIVVCHLSYHHIIAGILLKATHGSIPTLAPIVR